MAKLRAVVITDIHYGFDIKDKLGSKAPRLMEVFVKAVNKYAPDCVIDMGDRISARSKDDDRHYMKSLKAHYNKLAAPVYTVIGNHDIRYLERDENERIMGTPAHSYGKDIGDCHLVIWNPKYRAGATGIELEQTDIEWLESHLAKIAKPVILFSHVPLDNEGDEGLEPVSRYFFWTQGAQVRKIMEDSGNVILCMAGHRHRDCHKEINGIHYVTQQSFTNQWREHYRIPSRTFSFLELDDDKITIRLEGKFKKTYELGPRRPL